jgi:hypothetical protein
MDRDPTSFKLHSLGPSAVAEKHCALAYEPKIQIVPFHKPLTGLCAPVRYSAVNERGAIDLALPVMRLFLSGAYPDQHCARGHTQSSKTLAFARLSAPSRGAQSCAATSLRWPH